VVSADGDRHPSDSNGQGIATEWTKVEWFDDDTFIETEMPEPRRFRFFE
jgi:hypothetical protein